MYSIFFQGIYPPDYEDEEQGEEVEVENNDNIVDGVKNEEEDMDTDIGDAEISDQSDSEPYGISERSVHEADIMAQVIQELNSQPPRVTVASVSPPSEHTAVSSSVSPPSQLTAASAAVSSSASRTVKHMQTPAERKKDILAQAMQEHEIFGTMLVPNHDDINHLKAQVIQEHSYARMPQLGGTTVVQPQADQQPQPSFVVNSQQPRATVASVSRPSQYTTASAAVSSSASRTVKHIQTPAERKKDILAQAMQEQKLFDKMPRAKTVVKQEPGVAPGSNIKSVRKPATLVPNCTDLTRAVTGNPELENNNNDNKLVDWPHSVYINDYQNLGEGKWVIYE